MSQQIRQEPRLDGELRLLNHLGPGFFSPVSEPTPAVPVGRIATEWETARAVAVNVSIRETLEVEEILQLYLDLATAVTPYVPLLVGYDPVEEGSLGRFRERLRERLGEDLGPGGLLFMPTYTRSSWIRDYAPIFAYTDDGYLVSIDPVSRLLEPEMEAFANLPSSLERRERTRPFGRFQNFRNSSRKDDLAPVHIARFLRQTLEMECELSKPALHLQGGDFLTDGLGNIFISEDTFLRNGGQRLRMLSVFEKYFRAKSLHVLEAPPGAAAKHLDMTMKFTSSDTILISEPPVATKDATPYLEYIARTCAHNFNTNIQYLRSRFPEKRVILVPSPPLLAVSDEVFSQWLTVRIVESVCERLGIDFESYLKDARTGLKDAENQRRIDAHIRALVGPDVETESHEGRTLLAKAVLGESVEQLRSDYVPSSIGYRSYTNSLLIKNRNGAEAVILPRYKPKSHEPVELFVQLEQSVEAAYREALPNAKLHWVDCDFMAQRSGAIHCLTLSIPAGPEDVRHDD
ncbi:agmatine deiminase family protein [Pelagicoccus sp. SDUM812003]|nr:agmatine deiminase family protein [Pelagicoccus sp. SDUM812003]